MPVNTLLPTGPGFYGTNWLPAGAATNWQAVQTPDDDGTSYTENATVGQDPLTFVTSNLPSGAVGASILSHVLTGRAYHVNNGLATSQFYIRLAGADTLGTQIMGVSGAWTTGTQSNIARPGGGAWSAADVDAAEIGAKKAGADVSAVRLTTLKWDVTWEPASGGWTSLVASLGILSLLGGALALSEMPKLAREIALRSHGDVRVQAHEYADMHRELREGRRARHFLLWRAA